LHHLVARALQVERQQVPDVGLVFGDEDAFHGSIFGNCYPVVIFRDA
jgi:hypothetical protein